MPNEPTNNERTDARMPEQGAPEQGAPEQGVPSVPITESEGIIKLDLPVNQTITLPSALTPAQPPQPKSPAPEGGSPAGVSDNK